MKAERLLLLSLIFLFAAAMSDGGVIATLTTAFEVIDTIYKAWEIIRDYNELELEDIAGDLNKAYAEISGIESSVKSTEAAVYDLITRLNKNRGLELQLNELSQLMAKVKFADQNFAEHMKQLNKTERLTLEDFAARCVSQSSDSVSSSLDRIHRITEPVSEPGLINPDVRATLLDALKETDMHMCDMQQSPNQLLYNMYNTIMLTDIKGYIMMQMSWLILKTYGKGNFVAETAAAKRKFEKRLQMTASAARMVVREVTRDIRRCEPTEHIQDETFTSLTRLLQGYVENEVDMNTDNTCNMDCAYYQMAKNRGCFKDQFCSKQKACNGNILECQFIDSDMKICQSPATSHRRYDWIEYGPKNRIIYGRKTGCSTPVKVESWWRWLLWHCSYCLCICDQSGPQSDRYFSLRESLADVNRNKVVTGIRFTKQDRIIHIQISDGKLLPGGKIDPNSIEWKKIEPMELKYAKKNEDYHEMSYEERAINLDDLKASKGYVLTGVRFKMLGTHLNFQIQAMRFDLNKGKLKSNHIWISNDRKPVHLFNTRTEVFIENPDIPTNSRMIRPMSKSNQFIKFTHTDLKKDIAQTTIPYLDTQPVISKIPIPLSGAGIFFKGHSDSGGFIAPKIITYDFSSHLDTSLFELFKKRKN